MEPFGKLARAVENNPIKLLTFAAECVVYSYLTITGINYVVDNFIVKRLSNPTTETQPIRDTLQSAAILVVGAYL